MPGESSAGRGHGRAKALGRDPASVSDDREEARVALWPAQRERGGGRRGGRGGAGQVAQGRVGVGGVNLAFTLREVGARQGCGQRRWDLTQVTTGAF